MATQKAITLADLSTFVGSYVTAANSGNTTYTATKEDVTGMVDKIGSQFTIKGTFEDHLEFMNGNDLPLGRTVEEYFRAIAAASTWQGAATEGANVLVPEYIPFEKCAYSTPLDRIKFKATRDGSQLEAACISAEVLGNLVADLNGEIVDQKNLYKFNIKKAALKNLVTKMETASKANLESTVIVDTEDGLADFITAIRKKVKDLKFANENNNLGQCLIGALPDGIKPVLVIRKGLLDDIEAKVKAGAFHDEVFNLSSICQVEEVDDFAGNTKIQAVLMDPRTIKIRPYVEKQSTYYNDDGDFISTVGHYGVTVVTSLYTGVHAFVIA